MTCAQVQRPHQNCSSGDCEIVEATWCPCFQCRCHQCHHDDKDVCFCGIERIEGVHDESRRKPSARKHACASFQCLTIDFPEAGHLKFVLSEKHTEDLGSCVANTEGDPYQSKHGLSQCWVLLCSPGLLDQESPDHGCAKSAYDS